MSEHEDTPTSERPDTHGYPRDIDGYPADIDGYPADTEGYPEPHDGPSSEAEDESTQGDRAEPDGGDPRRWWAEYGFSSFQEYMQHQEEVQSTYFGPSPKLTGEVPTPSLGDPEPIEAPRTGMVAGRLTRQLCLRFRERDFERLSAAAASYGVRPTTLARMLVQRGVRAIVELDESAE